jgi:trypsin
MSTPTPQPNPNENGSRRRGLLAGVLAGSLGASIMGATLLLGGGSAGAIVNGTPTSASNAPWQVSLQDSSGYYCGGSILDATTIVTAAHCVEGETAAGTTVRAGVTDSNDTSGQDVRVASITSHPDYASTGVGDIAVIKLAEPLTFNQNVQPIAPASRAEIAAADTAVTSGWGAVGENDDDSPNQLQSATVPLVDDATCNAQLGTDADGEVCAGGTGTDSCYGDSGGPLVVQTPDGPKLAGVVSWGDECGGATPGVYAEVPNYVDFLRTGEATPTVPAPDAPAENPETPGDVDGPAPTDGFDEDDLSDEYLDDEYLGDDEYFDEDDLDGEFFGDDVEVLEFIDGEWVAIDTSDWTDADWAELDAELDDEYFGDEYLDEDDVDWYELDDQDGFEDDLGFDEDFEFDDDEFDAFLDELCEEFEDEMEHDAAV